jgi:tight adherence protein B
MTVLGFHVDTVYVFYFFAATSAVLFAEGAFLLFFSGASYRRSINHRLDLLKDEPNRQNVLLKLRRQRGLTVSGDYRLPLVALNQLVLQSGLTVGVTRLVVIVGVLAVVAFAAVFIVYGNLLYAAGAALFGGLILPFLALRILRARRHKNFGAQFPDALDIIVRSLRAGHPVPVAVSMVARELPDPVGSEFGIAADEITYGADLETAMRNLYFRVGQEDLPLFVTAVAIQAATGGNLSEILQNLSEVIRQRFKMRRKVRALAAEGRASALILSSLPIAIFAMIQIVAPDFYRSVWHQDITKIALACAGGWMAVGNFIMYRMVNFRI